jgi:hypothetical protein
MGQTVEDLGKAYKQKYPGSYDDLSDIEVGQKAKAKNPGMFREYADVKSSAANIPSAADQMGIKNPVGRMVVNTVEDIGGGVLDALEGIGSGGLSTVYNAGDLVRRATGSKSIINDPKTQNLIKSPDSTIGKVARFAEQAAEFAAPSSGVLKLTKGLPLLLRMAAEGATSAAVSGVQTGGDPDAMAAGGMTGAAGPAIGAGFGALAKTRIPQKFYQSALKPTWNMVRKEGLTMLDTGLKEQIPVSAKGLEISENAIDDIRKEISDGIKFHGRQGATIDSSKVLSRLDDLQTFYKNTAAPQEALDTLQQIKDQFIQYHGRQIPIEKAQQIKINTYQEVRKAYGEMATAKVEGLKQVARGIKEEISNIFPEISKLNERQSDLLGLNDALYRAVWRIENHQIMGIGSGIAAGAGGAILGGPGAATAFVGKLLLDDPIIKSKLAIALAKQGVPNPSVVVSRKLLMLKAAMQKTASSLGDSREQPTPTPAQ